jgi:hypothetical protein
MTRKDQDRIKYNRTLKQRQCIICHAQFETYYVHKLTCSKECSHIQREKTKRKGQLLRTRKWREKNPDTYRESKQKSDRKYALLNGDQKTPKQKKEMFGFYMLLHPEKYPFVKEHLGITRQELNNRFKMFEGCCYCGDKRGKSIEHLQPTSKSGQHIINNIFIACLKCNSSKSNNNFLEWYRNQSFYNSEREYKILQNYFAG